jgi:hypothetical protein
MILASILLRRRSVVGFAAAVPLMVFGSIMGAALIAMSRVMTERGIPVLGGMAFVIAGMMAVSVLLTLGFLRHVDDAGVTELSPSV